MSSRPRNMYKKLMRTQHLIFVDLECTSWNEPDQGNIAEKMEIIEIGAVRVLAGEVKDSFSALVRPVEHPNLSPFITSLTGITQSQVNIALPFASLVADFENWIFQVSLEEFPLLGSWGTFDGEQYRRECRRKALDSRLTQEPWEDMRARLAPALGKGLGLKRAVESLGLAFEGDNHRALADAQNIANIYISLRKAFAGDDEP